MKSFQLTILIYAAIAWLALVGNLLADQRIYTVHAAQLPTGQPADNDLLIGHLYAISIDAKTKVATWCCYRATEADGASCNSIARNWLQALPEKTLEADDYRGPEYDIGHLTPLATFKASQYAFELNLLANCAPQTPNLNRGPWVRLEHHIRDLAKDAPAVDVAIGPLFESEMPPLPNADEPHQVPSHFWAVVTPKGGSTECYIIDQRCNRKDTLARFAVSLSEVERRSNLKFAQSESG